MFNTSKLAVIAGFLIITACSKDSIEKIEPQVELKVLSESLNEHQPVIVDSKEIRYEYDYEGQEKLDWEHVQYFPRPEGLARIPMPWNSEASVSFSEDILHDYKKSDGWETYLNYSSTTLHLPSIRFSLYNKYRGILRYYFYLEGGTQDVKDYNILQHTIAIADNTPLANFSSQDIVDVDQNIYYSYGFEPQPIADYTWYAVEYELAYDKDVYFLDTSVQMSFFFSMVKKTAILINGKSLNELNVKLNLYNLPVFWDANAKTQDAALTFYGKNDIHNATNYLTNADINQLSNIELSGAAQKVLNGTISTSNPYNIKWNANIEISLESSGVGITNDSYYISGSDLSNAPGYSPFYERALGVFYLNKKPVYDFIQDEKSDHAYQYVLDVNSVEYLFNPVVLEVAEIQNIKQELVATEDLLVLDNQRANIFAGHILKSNKPLSIQGVRVSFEVVPKDGSEKVQIIKTFKAKVKE